MLSKSDALVKIARRKIPRQTERLSSSRHLLSRQHCSSSESVKTVVDAEDENTVDLVLQQKMTN